MSSNNTTNNATNGNTNEQRLIPIELCLEENGGWGLTYPNDVDLELKEEGAEKTVLCIDALRGHEERLRLELSFYLQGKQSMSPFFVKSIWMKILQGDEVKYSHMEAHGQLDLAPVAKTVDWLIKNRINKLKDTIAQINHNKALLQRQEEAESNKTINSNKKDDDNDDGSRGVGGPTGMEI